MPAGRQVASWTTLNLSLIWDLDEVQSIGLNVRNLGDREGARQCMERAVTIQRQATPQSPADLANALTNLGALEVLMGDGRGGRECMEEAIAIRQRVFGPGSGKGPWLTTRLAQALVVEGKPAEAEAELEALLASPGRHNPLDDVEQKLGVGAWHRASFAPLGR